MTHDHRYRRARITAVGVRWLPHPQRIGDIGHLIDPDHPQLDLGIGRRQVPGRTFPGGVACDVGVVAGRAGRQVIQRQRRTHPPAQPPSHRGRHRRLADPGRTPAGPPRHMSAEVLHPQQLRLLVLRRTRTGRTGDRDAAHPTGRLRQPRNSALQDFVGPAAYGRSSQDPHTGVRDRRAHQPGAQRRLRGRVPIQHRRRRRTGRRRGDQKHEQAAATPPPQASSQDLQAKQRTGSPHRPDSRRPPRRTASPPGPVGADS